MCIVSFNDAGDGIDDALHIAHTHHCRSLSRFADSRPILDMTCQNRPSKSLIVSLCWACEALRFEEARDAAVRLSDAD